MELVNEFLFLIHNTEPVAVILFLWGFVFITAGFKKSFYRPFLALGFLMSAAAIAIRMAGGGNLVQAFILLFIDLLAITLSFIVVMRLSKYGWIIREPVMSRENGRDGTHS